MASVPESMATTYLQWTFNIKNRDLFMDFVRDLFSFLRERKKWWLTPIILLLIFVGVLIVIGGSSAVAPFIYTLF
jgi:hypothetical protein